MNLLSNINEVNMDSREIAELTGKNHADVCRDIRNQLNQMQIGESIYASSYKSKQNKDIKCYSLDYEMTMILISGYSIPLRAKIIKRWTELENKNKPALPQSFSQALQLAADQAKQLELQAPKVEYYDKILDSCSTFTTTQVADDLNMSAMRLNKILVDIGIQYKQSGQFHLYAKIKPLKLAETRTKPYIKNSGQTATSHYLVWTEKGREYILNAVNGLFNE